MTTSLDEPGGNGRCSMPGCKRLADGLLCDEHRPGAPERLDHAALRVRRERRDSEALEDQGHARGGDED